MSDYIYMVEWPKVGRVAGLLLDSLPLAEMFTTIFMCCLHSGSVLSASCPCV